MANAIGKYGLGAVIITLLFDGVLIAGLTTDSIYSARRQVATVDCMTPWDWPINSCPMLVFDHHAERDGYFEIATVIDAPILGWTAPLWRAY